jgi:type IV secretion system protein TrbF
LVTILSSCPRNRQQLILTIRLQPPRTAERLRANPLGIYVHALNWSKELVE